MSEEIRIKEAGRIQINPATKNPFDEQIKSLKAHAVEVLAMSLWEQDELKRYEQAEAEARALLGWEE